MAKYDIPPGLSKLAASRLRQALKLVRVVSPDNFDHLSFRLHDKHIGEMIIDRFSDIPQVRYSYINPKFRGMNLGRKMYGDAMKMMPSGQLRSDSILSNNADGVWKSLSKLPSYTVERNPKTKYLAGAEQHVAHEPPGTTAGQPSLVQRLWRLVSKPKVTPVEKPFIYDGTITPKSLTRE